jgi:hypothetical protein
MHHTRSPRSTYPGRHFNLIARTPKRSGSHARMLIRVFSCCIAASPATIIRGNGQHPSPLITDAQTSSDPNYVHNTNCTTNSIQPDLERGQTDVRTQPKLDVHKHGLVHLQNSKTNTTLSWFISQHISLSLSLLSCLASGSHDPSPDLHPYTLYPAALPLPCPLTFSLLA